MIQIIFQHLYILIRPIFGVENKVGLFSNMEFRLYVLLHLAVSVVAYSVPDPKFEILKPKGFRISIPHENGIALVGFNINVNKPIQLNELGEYSGDVIQNVDNRWTLEEKKAIVDPGNKVSYWIHVQYRQLAFRKQGELIASSDNSESITKRFDPDEIISSTSTTTPRTNCELSATTVNRKAVCKGQLIFEDNFNDLNWTKWRREVRLPIDANDVEFVSYQNRDDNCYVSKGQLHIVPTLLSEVDGFNELLIRTGKLNLEPECTGFIDISKECRRQAKFAQILPPIVSARITTKEYFAFQYGTVVVRAKLPKGDWLYPVIALEPDDNYYGFTGYASGQMRIAFIRGNEMLYDKNGIDISGHRLSGGVVLSNKNSVRDIWLRSTDRASHLGNDFHIYSLTWTKDYISLEIDGNEYATLRGNWQTHRTQNIEHAKLWNNGHPMAPFDREFFLTLGLSVGGHGDFPDESRNGPDGTEKPWKNLDPKAELQFWNNRDKWLKSWDGTKAGLHVDYIRVHAL